MECCTEYTCAVAAMNRLDIQQKLSANSDYLQSKCLLSMLLLSLQPKAVLAMDRPDLLLSELYSLENFEWNSIFSIRNGPFNDDASVSSDWK